MKRKKIPLTAPLNKLLIAHDHQNITHIGLFFQTNNCRENCKPLTACSAVNRSGRMMCWNDLQLQQELILL